MSKSSTIRFTFRLISAVMLPWFLSAVEMSHGVAQASVQQKETEPVRFEERRSPLIPKTASQNIAAQNVLMMAQLTEHSRSSSSAIGHSSRSRVVETGDRGRIVSQIQLMLKTVNLYGGTIDGVYTTETALAVSQFQQLHNLNATGTVDQTTWNYLRAEFEQAQTLALDDQDATAQNEAQEERTAPDKQTATTIAPSLDSPAEPRSQEASVSSASPPSASGSPSLLQWLPFGVISLAIAIIFYGLGRLNRPIQLRLDRHQPQQGRSPSSPAAAELPPSSHLRAQAHPSAAKAAIAVESASTFEIKPTTRIAQPTELEIHQQNLRSSDSVLRRKAIWELGQRGTTESIQPLVNLMLTVDSQQRSLILAAISEIGVRTLKPLNHALITSMQDDSSDVRKNAIREIARVYELMGQVTSILRHAVNDSDEEVRQTATWALGQFNRLRLNPSLMPASEKSSYGIAHETVPTIIHSATVPERSPVRPFDADRE